MSGQLYDYVRLGIAVLPLHAAPNGVCTCGRGDCRIRPDGIVVGSPGKHPRTRNGKDDATLDSAQIARWEAQWPAAAVNWGGRPPEGVVVLDVDPRNGGDVNLARLERVHGSLGETLTCLTGSGGVHLWLRYAGPVRGLLCPGVDIKAHGGYLVMPPSVHATGAPYVWVHPTRPAPAPKWLREMLSPTPTVRLAPKAHTAKLDPLVRVVAEAPEGNRNRALYWAACKAVADGLDPTELITAAVSAGLTTREAITTIRSAQRSAA